MFIQQSLAQEEVDKPESTEQTDDETAVKAAIEAFLLALGTNDTLALPTFFLPHANIGSIRVKDGKTSIYTNSVEQWLADRAQKENNRFEEPVQEFTVEITQGRLAFVRANTTLLYNGEPSHYAHDFFILMQEDGQWKILSGSYTNLPLENE
jgi:hypothetical protein